MFLIDLSILIHTSLLFTFTILLLIKVIVSCGFLSYTPKQIKKKIILNKKIIKYKNYLNLKWNNILGGLINILSYTKISYFYQFNLKAVLGIFAGISNLSLKYYILFIFTQFLVMVILAALLYSLSKVLSKKIFNLDKKSAYECGFEPFLILTSFIEISFIIVAFIFLIFDLELVFLAGFLASLGSLGSKGIILVFSYLSTVWGMVLTEILTGILGWPRWTEYNFDNTTEILRKSLANTIDILVHFYNYIYDPEDYEYYE